MNTLVLWSFLRLVTSIVAAFVSWIKPINPIELQIPLYPPVQNLPLWLDRALLSPWLRWDAEWYQRIVLNGYTATDGTAQFHPLFPWLALPLFKIGISPILSLLIISSVASILLFYFFNRLAQLDLTGEAASFAIMLLTLSPPAFVLFAPYPEALFLLFSVLCLYFSRQKKWWLAGLMGGLAALTRQQGIFLILPMAVEFWESHDRKLISLIKQFQHSLAICLLPLGYISWLIYRAFFINDFQIRTGNFQDFIYSLMISPSASQVVQIQQFIWPWHAIYNGIEKVISNSDLDIWVNLISAAFMLILLAVSWKYLRLSYLSYSLILFIISFSYYTGPLHPYMGLPRHLFLAFPIYLGSAQAITKPWLRLILLMVSGLGMLFLLGLYVLHAWVP